MPSIDVSITLSTSELVSMSPKTPTGSVELRPQPTVTSQADCDARNGTFSTQSGRPNADDDSGEGQVKMELIVYCMDSDQHFNKSAAKEYTKDFEGPKLSIWEHLCPVRAETDLEGNLDEAPQSDADGTWAKRYDWKDVQDGEPHRIQAGGGRHINWYLEGSLGESLETMKRAKVQTLNIEMKNLPLRFVKTVQLSVHRTD
jgi:hypothetical protein